MKKANKHRAVRWWEVVDFLKMENKTLLWILIALLVISVIYVTFFRGLGTGQVVQTTWGNLDTTGWTEDEKMNYEMHGVIPSRISGGSSPSGSGMVGGC